jgi:hypothetical protein
MITIKTENLKTITETIDREIYAEEKYSLEVQRLKARMSECLAGYEWLKGSLHTSSMPTEEVQERLDCVYDRYVELRNDYERFAN